MVSAHGMSRQQRFDLACSLPQPDRRPMYEWAASAIEELPAAYAIRGRFSVDNSPWLRAPFDSMLDPLCRRTTVSKAVQSGGTLLAEIATAYRIVNDPGPCTFTCQSDEMATLEGKTRMMPLFESIRSIARILPRPGPLRTQTEVFFPGGSFFILNSANLAHQQSQSVRHKINDEVWMPKWADVYEDACRRVTAFEQQGISHILDISQGGHEGDWAEWSFLNGTQEEWAAPCEGCGKPMPLHFRQAPVESGMWAAGVVWDLAARRDDGTWNDARAAETVRFRCVHCGHEHADNDRTRARWRRTGLYLPPREGSSRHWRSFHWEAVVAHPLSLLAAEWCQAENLFARMGDQTARAKFRQKREARTWKEERPTITMVATSDYKLSDYADGRPIPGELHRFMALDRQQRGWWVEIGAWTPTPEYWQLFFGHVETLDMVRELQKRYRVPDSCVAQDRRYEAAKVDAECVRFGWRGMLGHKRKTWTMRDEATQLLATYPHSDPRVSQTGDGQAIFYEFSGSHCKDILAAALSGSAFKWRLPSDVNPLYLEHLKAEEKKEVRPGAWEWVEVKQNANHGMDTSAMMIAVAIVVGLVKFNSKADES